MDERRREQKIGMEDRFEEDMGIEQKRKERKRREYWEEYSIR